MADHYETLGVPKNASQDDIKKAFRTLAHKHHPDKQGGDDATFKKINEAYQTVGDPEKRAKYDQFGANYEQMGGFGGGNPFGGQNPFGGFGGGGVEFDMGDLGSMFGDMFGGGRQGARREPARGRHIEMDIHLTFHEAAFGVEKEVKLHRVMTCDDCGGNGAEKGSKMTDCGQCHGSGQVRRAQQTILGTFQTMAPCNKCDARGKLPEKPCRKCHGTGLTKGQREMQVKVPAGVADGEVLRVSGEGEAAPHGGRSGDLYLKMRVKQDPRFVRDGFDVRSAVEIGISLAALGGEIDIDTIDGKVSLNIPAGTQPGHVHRLKAKGIPHLRGGARGDHYVEVIVKVPKKLSKEQKKLLEEWGEEGF